MAPRRIRIDPTVGDSPTERAKLTWREHEFELTRMHVHVTCWACAVVLAYILTLVAGAELVAKLAPLAGALPDLAREIADKVFNF